MGAPSSRLAVAHVTRQRPSRPPPPLGVLVNRVRSARRLVAELRELLPAVDVEAAGDGRGTLALEGLFELLGGLLDDVERELHARLAN